MRETLIETSLSSSAHYQPTKPMFKLDLGKYELLDYSRIIEKIIRRMNQKIVKTNHFITHIFA